MSSQHQTSSRQLSHKPVENSVQRDVIAPDKPPRVRWHSECHVWICRNVAQFILFILFLAGCFILGPSLISFMYPNVLVPLDASLDWRCVRLEVYSQIEASNLMWETNLMAASSAINIQIYMKQKNKTLDDLQKILLVVDDCGFDIYGESVALCRPMTDGSRLTFRESVKMAKICYQYVRQMTKEAEIVGYGKGIAANIILAAAAELQEEFCYGFEFISVEDPIFDVKAEFMKSNWIGIRFMLPFLREKMMMETIREYGFHEAEFDDNIRRVKSEVLGIAGDDYDSIYGKYGDLVKKGKRKGIFFHIKTDFQQNVTRPLTNFRFRHQVEEACVKKSNLPITSVIVI